MEALKMYSCEDKQYFLVKDLMNYKRGFRSEIKFIEALNLEPTYGRICADDESFRIDERRSKKLSKIFVSVDQVKEEDVRPRANKRVDGIELIEFPEELDPTEFCFFKDNQGVEHDVTMYGERTKEGILFKLKDIEELFGMTKLEDNIHHPKSSFEFKIDFVKSKPKYDENGRSRSSHVTFLTIKGLIKVMRDCKSGDGKRFIDHLEDFMLTSMIGNVEQRTAAIYSLAQGKFDLFKDIFGRHTGGISCIYLIKTSYFLANKCVYKYGFTKDLDRRFKEHSRVFGKDIELEAYFFIREDNLSKAEKDMKIRLAHLAHIPDEAHLSSQKELLLIGAKELKEVRTTMNNIYTKYSDSQLESINKIREMHNQEILKAKEECFERISGLKEQHTKEVSKLEMEIYKLNCDIKFTNNSTGIDPSVILQMESRNNALHERLENHMTKSHAEILDLVKRLESANAKIDLLERQLGQANGQ